MPIQGIDLLIGAGVIIGIIVLIWMLRDKGDGGPKSPPIYQPKSQDPPEK